ncbi:unnamed protein product [Dovyalis caffra]|uniref:Uncharacterized protein n=1 Tax=Dovyalis caffra TaxID=77055 RepID=A0AAV1SW31_9ROSI|nr:unnamed protein product [Dovyalis caffra]
MEVRDISPSKLTYAILINAYVPMEDTGIPNSSLCGEGLLYSFQWLSRCIPIILLLSGCYMQHQLRVSTYKTNALVRKWDRVTQLRSLLVASEIIKLLCCSGYLKSSCKKLLVDLSLQFTKMLVTVKYTDTAMMPMIWTSLAIRRKWSNEMGRPAARIPSDICAD